MTSTIHRKVNQPLRTLKGWFGPSLNSQSIIKPYIAYVTIINYIHTVQIIKQTVR